MNEEFKVIISAEIEKLKKGVEDAKSAIGTFKSEIEKNKETISESWTTIGEAATKASKVMLTSVAAIGAALVANSVATQDYREEQAKLQTAFQAAGAGAETAKNVYGDLYRVLGESDRSVEAANHLAQLTTNEQALSEWTTVCQGVFATFGDSLPIESLTEAANETAKVGTVTGSLADALNWSTATNEQFAASLSGNASAQTAFNNAIAQGESREDAFNAALQACNSESEREQLIRQALIGTYGEAAAMYEQNAAETLANNEAQLKLKESLADLGEAVAPLITAFTRFAAEALEKVTPYVKELGEKAAPVLKNALSALAKALEPTMEFISNNFGLIATIGGIILGIAAAYQVCSAALTVYNTIKAAYTLATTIATAATTAFGVSLYAAMGYVTLIIAVIGLLVAAVYLLVDNWDSICAAFKDGWKNIIEWFSNGAEKVKNTFNNLKNNLSTKANEIKADISNKFNEIKNNISNSVSNVATAATNGFNNMRNSISNTINNIKSNISTGFNNMKASVTNIVTNMKTSVSTGFSNISNAISSALSVAKNNALNIFDNIRSGIADKINAARDAVRNAINQIKEFFNFKWELPKIKLPHLKVTGKFSLNPPQVPDFNIDWYARGGVFDKPTLFNYGGSVGGLGEAGAEAIVPLENNLGWLDKLADMLSNRMGGNNQPIVLQVDGKVLAQTSIESINKLTKQTGKLNLVLG